MHTTSKRPIGRRLLVIKIIILVFFISLTVRLYIIQIKDHNKYAAVAEKQHWIGKELPAKRGEIVTSDGYALATNVPAYEIYGVPQEIEDPKTTAEKLLEVIGFTSTLTKEQALDEDLVKAEKEQHINSLEDNLKEKDLLYVSIAKKQDEEIKKKIEELSLSGIYFEKDYKRFYPENNIASRLLGFVGKNDRGEDQGYYGIEGYFNGDLKGISGRVALEKDALGRPIPVGAYIPVASDDGRTIVLTINRQMQYMVERKLEEGVKKYDAQDGTVIIMEPHTGKILAMASYPNYNPTTWSLWTKDYTEKKEEDLTDSEKQMKKYGRSVYPNLAVADVYEPGSIFKPITMSIALEKGKVTSGSTIESAPYPISSYTIRTWNDKYFGLSSPAEILQHSDNTGMARVSQIIGLPDFYEYLGKYGLINKTGITLEDEDKGWIKDQEDWMDVDLATAAFGQGISVTPIQMMQAYTAFINDGMMLKPYIVQEMRTERDRITYEPQEVGTIISSETARTIVDMLVSVVEKGEFKFAVLPGYKIAGKTGTAQIAKEGRYDASQTNCTFIGFSPAVDSKFLMLVKLTRPTASTYSAETAVPLWMNIAKELFVSFGIAPINTQ